MGLRLSVEMTRDCHTGEWFDFLGWRIQRQPWRSGTGKWAFYTYPSKKAVAAIVGKCGR
jgi:RNA-directed DNA polymerase